VRAENISFILCFVPTYTCLTSWKNKYFLFTFFYLTQSFPFVVIIVEHNTAIVFLVHELIDSMRRHQEKWHKKCSKYLFLFSMKANIPSVKKRSSLTHKHKLKFRH